MTDDTEAMGRDLDLIDLMTAMGNTATKKKALKHRKAIMDEIHRMNERDGLNEMTDDELLKELTK